MSLLALHLRQRCLRLGQPEGHVHGAVERDSSGQLSARLLLLAGLEIQGAEAAVAVGQKRTHAEFFGQGEGLTVVSFGLLARRRLACAGSHQEA